MFWASFLLTFLASGVCGRGERTSNLAWEVIQGFIRLWNRTYQGICIQIPTSAEQGIRFGLIPVKFNIGKYNVSNGTVGLVDAPFE